MTPEIALRSDYKLVPTFLHENVPDAGQLGDEDKGTTFAEPHIPRLFNSLISRVNKSGFGLDMDCTDESDLAYRPLEVTIAPVLRDSLLLQFLATQERRV